MKDTVMFLILVNIVGFFYLKATNDIKEPKPSSVAENAIEVSEINYSDFDGEFRYCFVGEWAEENKAIFRNGFGIWWETGITFIESSLPNCDTEISLTSGEPGEGSLYPDYIKVNPIYLSDLVAAHEIGHNLGLKHEESGLMYPYIMDENGMVRPLEQPSKENIETVRQMWGIE